MKKKQEKLVVILRSCGNPDFRQDPDKRLSPTKRVTVRTLQEASAQVREYIGAYNLGGGNWIGGQVLRDGKPYAYISYNGAAWEPSTGVYRSRVDDGALASERFMGTMVAKLKGNQKTFEQLARLCPASIDGFDRMAVKTIDDLIFEAQHEIDMFDEDQDGHTIRNRRERASVVKFIDLCVANGGERVQD